jgi:hypothetical protein
VSDGRIFVYINFTMVHSFKGRNRHFFIIDKKKKNHILVGLYYYTETVSKQELSNRMSAVPCGFWGIGPISSFQLGSRIVLQLVPVGKELVKHFEKCWYKLF